MSSRKLSNTHRTSGKRPGISRLAIFGRRLAALSAACAGACLALTAVAGPANAVTDPSGPADVAVTPTPSGPPNYNTTYTVRDPESHPVTVTQHSGLDAAAIEVGALGGLSLGTAGLGVTYVVRRRHHTAAPAS